MLPVVSGDASTRRQILLYMLILVPLGIAPWLLGYTGTIYGITAIISGAIMLTLGWQVLRERPPAERASRTCLPSRSCTCFSSLQCCWSIADGAG